MNANVNWMHRAQQLKEARKRHMTLTLTCKSCWRDNRGIDSSFLRRGEARRGSDSATQ